jgi:hypothetical protein
MPAEKITEAIKTELQRQAAGKPCEFSVDTTRSLQVDGIVNRDALALQLPGA